MAKAREVHPLKSIITLRTNEGIKEAIKAHCKWFVLLLEFTEDKNFHWSNQRYLNNAYAAYYSIAYRAPQPMYNIDEPVTRLNQYTLHNVIHSSMERAIVLHELHTHTSRTTCCMHAHCKALQIFSPDLSDSIRQEILLISFKCSFYWTSILTFSFWMESLSLVTVRHKPETSKVVRQWHVEASPSVPTVLRFN